MTDTTTDIRLLSKAEALAVLPDLCETLADCIEGGASLGFMSPFSPKDGEGFWRSVAEAVGRGEVLLYGSGGLCIETQPAASGRSDEIAGAP
jgi:hypothetical protein